MISACITQLQQPRDEGIDQFWVDFNIATTSLSLYADDMSTPGNVVVNGEDDGMWESVIVKNNNVKEWSVTSKGIYMIMLV